MDSSKELRKAESIWRRMFPRGLGSDTPKVSYPAQARFDSDHCPDHWSNVIIFGQCWKHNVDGSIKTLFSKS